VTPGSIRAVFDAPIAFRPLFRQRVWGGRRLERVYGKPLPADAVIGESWELVDRAEAQSVSTDGTDLHALWTDAREAVFGARGVASPAPRFPILVKLLDARETLSVQVHPPAHCADDLGGECKSEAWVLAAADPGAHVYAGLRAGVTREAFESALHAGEDVSAMLHRIDVRAGDAIFIPSGRVHAIGGGCLIAEIQQNSDTTYRVFDFNRPGLDGLPRELHLEESLRSIDFDDVEPPLADPAAEHIAAIAEFELDRWTLAAHEERPAAPAGEAAVVLVLEGEVGCGDATFGAGGLFLAPASAALSLTAGESGARVVRVLLGPGA
jgi:mannose-6-phosphate isomerase